MSTVQDIVTLQAFDNEAAALRAALAAVEQRLEGDPELDEARRSFQEWEAASAAERKEQRRIDGEIADLTSRIEPEEKRLYDGSVKNPKELANIQHELDLLKAQRTTLEEQLLTVMSQIDVAERAVDTAKADIARLEERWEGQAGELRLEAKKLADAIATADQKCTRQKDEIPPRELAIYENLKRRKGGTAVAKLQGGVCQACRIMVPEGIRRRVFSPAQLAQCPSCDRILAVG